MDLGLTGKVAMVAGASRGLGFAVSRALAAEGARVSMASHDNRIHLAAEAIEGETGGAIQATRCNLRSLSDILRWRDETADQFGGVDLLFSNTGGPPPGTFEEVDEDGWQAGFELLVLAPIRMVRAVIPIMRSRGGGSIVLSTSSSIKEPIPDLAVSTAMRPSVAAIAKLLSIELAESGIRVNQLVPGRIYTDRVKQLDAAKAERTGISAEEQQRQSTARIPMGRYGTPEEYARAASFLFSEAASYVTGATLQVDGGMIRSAL